MLLLNVSDFHALLPRKMRDFVTQQKRRNDDQDMQNSLEFLALSLQAPTQLRLMMISTTSALVTTRNVMTPNPIGQRN